MSSEFLSANNRRQSSREHLSYPVIVNFVDISCERIRVAAKSENISIHGLFMRVPYALEVGKTIFTFITLPTGAGIAAFGKIVRVENQEKMLPGIAVFFSRIRLYSLQIPQ